jgi:hypothetical protein
MAHFWFGKKSDFLEKSDFSGLIGFLFSGLSEKTLTYQSDNMAHFLSRTKPTNPCLYSIFVVDSPCLFGARFSAATAQLCRRIALPFWGQVFSHQGSGLSSACNRLFGARFSVATVQLCRRLALAFWVRTQALKRLLQTQSLA